MIDDMARRAADHGDDAELHNILRNVCALTGMGFAAVARVTEDRWIACQVLDQIDFGMAPGDELKVSTTICSDVRSCGEAVVIDHVDLDEDWRTHPTPIMYGFKSYVSLPVHLDDGTFYGTLCALDPKPHRLREPRLVAELQKVAKRVGKILTVRVAETANQSNSVPSGLARG